MPTTTSRLSIALTHLSKGAPRFTVASRRRDDMRAASDAQRRAHIIEALHADHAASGDQHRKGLPTDRWINAQLARRGEGWRVHTIDGFRYEIFDVTA